MTTPEYTPKTEVMIAHDAFDSDLYRHFNNKPGKIDANKDGNILYGKSGKTVSVITSMGAVFVPFDKVIVT